MEKNEALAPPWWESFGFSRNKKLKIDSTSTVTYGAIFEMTGPSRCAPKYVVALRGTIRSCPQLMKDLMQDILVLFNNLEGSDRFNRTRSDVDHLTSNLGSGSVWLAGHSLGASMALGIGRDLMLDKGRNVPTILFNPPHVSPAWLINKLLSEEHKTLLYTLSSKVKFGLAKILPPYDDRTKEEFQKLAPWVPELYVNPDDKICRGHIEYFVQWELVHARHPRSAETAARVSYRDMLFFFSNKSQPHLLPSARLWTSSTTKEEAHKLRQWWKPGTDLALTNKLYVYPLD
ncbi:hypothetical protein ACQ4PT_020458 [Festuca glaucescens]